MASQFNVYTKAIESSGTISLGIAAAVVVLLVLILFLYLNRRVCSNNFVSCEDTFQLSHPNRKCWQNVSCGNYYKNYLEMHQIAQFPTLQSHNEEHTRYSFYSHVKNECEPVCENQMSDKVRAKRLIRNRGSWSSSSESTTAGGGVGSHHDEEPSIKVVRPREIFRYARTFSLQEEQMPLTVTRKDMDDQYSDIHSAFSDSMSGIIGKCGLLEVAFAYDAPVKNMTIHVLQARDIPATDRGRPPFTQVHVVLLPGKKQKQKSKIRHGDNPQYMESFLFHRVTPEDVNNLSVRFRLYGRERMRRHRLIGECIVSFSNVNLQLQSNIWVPLEPRANSIIPAQACEVLSLCQSDSTGSVQSMQHGGGPELLIGLSYNGITGRLSVEVIKGSNFRHVTATKAPDTYVKLQLLSSTGHQLAWSKTSTRKGQTNPLFKELFMYQVALFQLCDVTLLVKVFNRKTIKGKEQIGWFSLGKINTGPEGLAHWSELKQHKDELLSRWHVLKESCLAKVKLSAPHDART